MTTTAATTATDAIETAVQRSTFIAPLPFMSIARARPGGDP
jgi:hypothetical protein